MTNIPRLPRILLTNDDGIDAPGLALLEKIAHDFADEVWIVAPETDQSGISNAITVHEPVRFTQRDEKKWAVRGTPSDCVAIACSHLMADAKPNLIIAGVNSGANVGDEVNISGTIGAAMTGLLHGIPSMAISQAYKDHRDNIKWDVTETHLPTMLKYFLTEGWKKDTCLSINFPALPPEDVKGFLWATQAQKNLTNFGITSHISPRGKNYAWITVQRKESAYETTSDMAIMDRGRIAVSALGLNRSVEVLKPGVKFEES